jgi:hypothetical protein
MLPYRRERELVSQPPTPDGSMAVIKVNLVTSAAFHNDGRLRGSSKVTSHSKWVDTGLHCPWHRFPHTSANHDNSPAASTEVSAGICGPERIALINPYGPPGRYSDRDARVWRSVRPLLHTCERERAWRGRQHRQAAGTPAPRVMRGCFALICAAGVDWAGSFLQPRPTSGRGFFLSVEIRALSPLRILFTETGFQ